MQWLCPIPLVLIPSDDSMSFRGMAAGETSLPLAPHPGSFGAVRKHHTHEGIDLYCADGTSVFAVEAGVVVSIIPFTGKRVQMDWWDDTDAVLIEGESGVVLYGEVTPHPSLIVGQTVERGALLGNVKQVLLKDKGRPMSMLHLELHVAGTSEAFEWPSVGGCRPPSLLDPTDHLRTVWYK